MYVLQLYLDGGNGPFFMAIFGLCARLIYRVHRVFIDSDATILVYRVSSGLVYQDLLVEDVLNART